ncbi:MAG: response regulator [Bacteroidaceae bacterium]|nr:response regulator [Bacteroidaceae bacterium]MCF0187164.1 response regulator [Bacteroidaceae bacterium]
MEEGKNRKKLLLIAEDDRSNFRYLQFVLRKDYEILWAQDGLEAIEMACDNDVVMVLMDNKMPVTSGVQALSSIKKTKPNLPIIMQTAYAFDTDVETAMEAGADGYLTKPIMRDQLMKMVEKFDPKSE